MEFYKSLLLLSRDALMNDQTSRRKFIALYLILLALSCNCVMAATANVYRIILGDAPTATLSSLPGKTHDEAYVRQSRAVRFDTKLLAISSPLKVGDTIILDVLSNLTYSVVIDSVTHDPFGSVSILGTIAGAKLGTVNLTANNGAVIGTVQDLDKNRLFSIRCVGTERTHYILDYDVERMPARYDLPAIEPPMSSRKGGAR